MPAETRDRVLDAAEGLFAERGFAAVGVREITRAAGANAAAVNYHFGSKLELYRAVLKRRIDPINAERVRRLEAARRAAGSEGLSPEAVVQALLRPVFETMAHPDGRPNRRMIALGSRAILETPQFFQRMHREFFQEIRDLFSAALHDCLPHLGPEAVQARFFFLISVMTGTITQTGAIGFATKDLIAEQDFLALTDRFLAYAAAAVQMEFPEDRSTSK